MTWIFPQHFLFQLLCFYKWGTCPSWQGAHCILHMTKCFLGEHLLVPHPFFLQPQWTYFIKYSGAGDLVIQKGSYFYSEILSMNAVNSSQVKYSFGNKSDITVTIGWEFHSDLIKLFAKITDPWQPLFIFRKSFLLRYLIVFWMHPGLAKVTLNVQLNFFWLSPWRLCVCIHQIFVSSPWKVSISFSMTVLMFSLYKQPV